MFGSAGRGGTRTVCNLDNRQGLTHGKLTEDAPAALARDGGQDVGEGKPRRQRTGGGWCWIWHEVNGTEPCVTDPPGLGKHVRGAGRHD